MALEIKTGTYKKLKGAAGSQGTDYQLKLLEYFMLEGFHNASEFLLSTENEEAEIFDDVVYQTQERIILVQAKHTCRNIGFDQLFSLKSVKGDFNLYKYLKVFPTILKNFGTENIHVIICASSKFNGEKINSSLNKEIKTDELKYFKTETVNLLPYINNAEYHCFDSNQELLVEYIYKNVNEISKNVIKLFLDKLSLAYVSDKDLDVGIESLIEKIDLTDKINLKQIRNNIFNKIKTWFQSDKGFYLRKKHALAYFSEIISQNYINPKINSLFLLKDEYVKKLDKDDYPVSQNNLILLKIQNKDTYDLHEFKIYQFLINNLMFKNNEGEKEKLRDQMLFINPQFSENVTSNLIKSFEMPEYIYLIVPIFDNHKFYKIQNLLKNTIEIQKNKQYKKIIFVVDTVEVKSEINQFSGNIKNFAINIKFSDFSETTQKQILQQTINFQGNKIPFQKIIENKNLDHDFIDEDTLLQLIINKKEIEVNNHIRTNEEIPYYVNRHFKKTDKILIDFNCIPLTEFKYDEKCFSEHILNNSDNKFIVIFDSPGMGKSTILQKLYNLLRAGPYWIIKVNLNDCTKMLWKLRKEKREIFTLNEFLNLLQFPNKTHLESKIFNISKNVVLLLDSLDEISPEYTDLILDSFSSIAKNDNIRKIVITSRTHIVDNFEEKNFNYEKYCLVPFSEQESVNLLCMFWGKEENRNNLEKITEFANSLIVELNKKTSWGEIKTLIGIPLQTKMIADIFAKHCKDFLKNPKRTLELPEVLNLGWLYDEFVKRKKEIYIEEKCNTDGNINTMEAVENQFIQTINEHIKEALKLEFPEDQKFFKILNTPRKFEEKIFLKMGILIKSGDKINFIHKTLSEYFVTRYICELILNNKISNELLKYLMASYLVHRNMFIKYMLDDKSIPQQFKNQFFNLIDGVEICHLIQIQPEFIMFLFTKFGYTKLFQLDCVETLHQTVAFKYTNMFLKKLEIIDNFSNLRDRNGNSPLRLAFKYNSKEVVDVLLKKGHPWNIYDKYGKTHLHYAALWDTTLEPLIDKGHPIDVPDLTHGRTPLHYAVGWGKIANVRVLLDRGHPIDVRDKEGTTPLHEAAFECNTTIIQLLIDKGHPIDVRNKKGATPLHYAVYIGNKEIVELLIKNGHPINVPDKNGTTPLHDAAIYGNKPIVELLINKGHPIDIRNNYNRTLLHYAVYAGNKETVELLINKGHPIDVKDKKGKTPLDYAVERQLTHIQDLLENAGGIKNDQKTQSCIVA